MINFAQTTVYQRSADHLSGALVLTILGTIIFGGLLLRYGIRYLFFRRRLKLLKSKQPIITEYEAPIDIPAAFFGVMVDNRGSIQDLYATVLDLSYDGYIVMTGKLNNNDLQLQTTTKTRSTLLEHQLFVMNIIDNTMPAGMPSSQFGVQSLLLNNEFNFLAMKDLQRTGYYYFHKKMETLSAGKFYTAIIGRAVLKGIIKPWNWPGLLLSVFFPPFAILWLVISLIFYNRIGNYNYRTDKWAALWPELAGYYNYLKIVEAPKRQFELKESAGSFKLTAHDPYLVAAQLQKGWLKIFVDNSIELGAGGNEYRTW